MIMAGVSVHAEDPALRVEGATGRDGMAKAPLVLTMSDLAGMPRTSARVRSRDGKKHTYEGVLLSELDPAFADGEVIVADKLDGQPLPGREGSFC
jgi:hypothetical protein